MSYVCQTLNWALDCIHSFIQQILIEHLLCQALVVGIRGQNSEENKIFAPLDLIFLKGRQISNEISFMLDDQVISALDRKKAKLDR